MLAPVLRLAVVVFADTREFPDVDTPNTVLDTSLNDVFGKAVEEVGSTFRPLSVESSSFFTTRVVTFSDFFREVIAVLFEAIAGVQVGLLGAVRDGSEVADTEVNTRCFVAGCGGCLDFVFTDEVDFPPLFPLVVDRSDLLQVLDGDARACLVFDKDVFPCFRVFLVIRTF